MGATEQATDALTTSCCCTCGCVGRLFRTKNSAGATEERHVPAIHASFLEAHVAKESVQLIATIPGVAAKLSNIRHGIEIRSNRSTSARCKRRIRRRSPAACGTNESDDGPDWSRAEFASEPSSEVQRIVELLRVDAMVTHYN